jgi:hypothetical protein
MRRTPPQARTRRGSRPRGRPAIVESLDQKQSTAADVVRTSRADFKLEAAALIDHLAANNALVELKSEDDLATSMH